ncbi:unnamed protein product [Polarella glacialis]|uniref:Uncharacterized protein n=1 Tax=Polarella glacialis TaxID=89957 RepID=A0A813ECQ3_POLGL|nr:unnamed protein product [Polarella glacialis]
MNTPYLVITHRRFCVSCRRDVDNEETVINDDDMPVHLGCGTVLDIEGAQMAEGSGRCLGDDLVCQVIDGQSGAEADWLAAQRAILASLPGSKKSSRVALDALAAAAAAAKPRQVSSVAPPPVVRDLQLLGVDSCGKRRKGREGTAAEVPAPLHERRNTAGCMDEEPSSFLTGAPWRNSVER